MSVDKNHSEQFEKYLKGKLTSSESNEFERALLNNPFTQEALEGLESINPNIAFDDINKLKRQIKVTPKKGFFWMKIAAAVAFLIVSSLTIWFSIDQVQIENEKELAIEEDNFPQLDNIVQQDSILVEEVEELIADATPLNLKADKVKKDGLRMVDTNELVDKKINTVVLEELEPLGNQQLAEADIPVEEIQDLETVSDETALHGRVAGVKMERSKIVGASSLDTSELDDEAILTQPSIAQETKISSAKMIESDSQVSNQAKSEQGFAARSANSFTQTISGKVTDDSGEALPGVTVVIKGTTIGTQTDLDGTYMLVKSDGMTLVYSFVGFESTEIEVGSRTTLDVSMSGTTELQEVVVTGYGDSDESLSYSPAKPVIGNRKYTNYLKNNLQYPVQAKSNEIEGTIVLEITISLNGEVSTIDIKKSLGYGCDEEAIRLIKEGSKWEAAQKDGAQVEDKVRVRVKFKL